MYLTLITALALAPNTGIQGYFVDGAPRQVSVNTSIGEINGKIEKVTFDGKSYNVKVFLGIPYAEPPTGNNRFRKPVPKEPFKAPFLALDYGASCLQKPNKVIGKSIPMAEDCLFLNIFAPEKATPVGQKLPVMIWIHGGGFVHGTSTYYPGDILSVFGDVIVVTINYRLAQIGFLRTNESAANFGLWDQHLAIKWVNDYISSFGGDISNITIFGESAGSSSIVYQVLFPGNKGLFQRGIAQSGGITSPWAFAVNASADATFRSFSAEVGCSVGTHDDIMVCLRNKTTDEVANVMSSMSLTFENAVPNRDADFVPKHPQDMIIPSLDMKASFEVFYNVDFMMGSCSIDGALYLPYIAAAFNITDPDKFKVPRDAYEDRVVPDALAAVFTNIKHIPKVANAAAVFEYTNWTYPDNDYARNIKLIELMTDSGMLVPTISMVRLHTNKSNSRTYMYEFSTAPTTHYLPVPSWLEGPTNANHADDVFFVFGFPSEMIKLWTLVVGRPFKITPRDIEEAKVVMSMWTNFAKTGNPNRPYSVSTTWPQYNMTSQTYLDITPTITSESVKNRIAANRIAFWEQFLPTILKSS